MSASGAVLSDDLRYRYLLWRWWSGANGPTSLGFVMLNPSTADADVDDPTIRRCAGFARAHGFDGIVVANLYAYRATRRAELWRADDPIGPENNRTLVELMRDRTVGQVVAAWGAADRNAGLFRSLDVEKLARLEGRRLWCLGTTRDGAPRHPLYVRGDTPLTPYVP